MKALLIIVALLELLLPLAECYKPRSKLSPFRKPFTHSRAGYSAIHQTARGATHNATFSIATNLEIRRSFGSLLPRQECEPGFFPCDFGCCEDGTTCVATGCCPGAQEACGSRCYDPETEVCCEEYDTACLLSEVCIAGGKCCPEGQEACGEDGCYDPETEVCCSDTSGYCEEGYVCVEDGCCPSGMEKCGSDWCYNSETDVCCTDEEDSAWACINTYECCALSGGCYDSDTEICCEGGACLEGETCCTEECCTGIATCGEDGFCTATRSLSITDSVSQTFISEPTATETQITEQTNTETETETETKPATSTMSATTTPTPTITTPSITASTTTTSRSTISTPSLMTSSSVSSTSACSIKNQRRSAPLPTFTIKYEETMTVLPVSQTAPGAPKSTTVCLDNREILVNICNGIEQYTGCGSNQMQLTYGRGLNAKNRPQVCPSGSCTKYNVPCSNASDLNEICNPYYNLMNQASGLSKQDFMMSCDEFPPGSTRQGGTKGNKINTGVTACVPGWENTRQGTQLLGVYYYWLAQQKIKPQQYVDYILEVTGWDCATKRPTTTPQNCKGPSTPSKRDNLGGASVGPGNFNFFPNATGNGQNGLLLILGDVDAGVYTYTLTVHSGTFTTVVALDSNGIPVYKATDALSTGNHVVSFEVDYYDSGVAIWALTSDTDASISYNVTSQPLPLNSTTTCTTTVEETSTSIEPCTTSSSTSTEPCTTSEGLSSPSPATGESSSDVTTPATIESSTSLPSTISETPESTPLLLSTGAVSSSAFSVPATTANTASGAGTNTTPLPVFTASGHRVGSIGIFGMVLTFSLASFALL